MADSRICLLGKPALFIEGALHPFGGPRKAIALLAYVLQHRERTLLRATVAEQFWPDEDDENARAALRRHLHRALAALPAPAPDRPWILADKVTLRWNPDAPLEIDTRTYESAIASGDHEAAVALYRGDYLDGFYDDWILAERERLREMQAASLIALAEGRRRALDYAGAIGFALTLVRLDPMREDGIRRLMALRFAAGDRSGALADYEAFARRLQDELATEPMPETLALREAIRRGELDTRATKRAARPELPKARFPFTGRAKELKALRDAWETAAAQLGTTAIVSGEAGAGKSRLIAELATIAASQGGRVIFGTTEAIESEPYQPIAEALRGALPLLNVERLERVKAAALSSLLPGLREVSKNLPQLPQLEAASDRQRLFDAVQTAIEQLAARRPLLVVLEDVHWAGAATIALLAYVVRLLGDSSVLVVVTFREERFESGNALREFVRALDPARSVRIALGALVPADVRALVAAAAPDRNESFADELFAATEGNALFLTELLTERLKGAPGASSRGIAATVVDRLSTLSQEARTLAEVAAVVGAGFDTDVVRQSCGWSLAEVFDALDELLDRSIVRVSQQRRGTFAFSHQLVHSAVYEVIDDATKASLHRRVAKTLEVLFADSPSQSASIARHYDAAGFAAEALGRYLLAVRYALDVFAHDEAIALAARALELCSDPKDRFEILRLHEEAAVRAGALAARRSDCAAMLEIARSLGDDDRLGVALARAFAMHFALAEGDAAARATAELRALGERAASPRWTIEAVIAEARVAREQSGRAQAEAVLRAAEPLATLLEDDRLAFEYWYHRAFTSAWGSAAEASADLAHARAHAGDDKVLATRALGLEARIAEMRCDASELARLASLLLESYRQIGDLSGQAESHLYLAQVAAARFDIAADREHAARAIELFERIGRPKGLAVMLAIRAVTAQRVGDFSAAKADFERGRAMSESLGMTANASVYTRHLSYVASLSGEYARARELASEALSFAREHDMERDEMHALGELGNAERGLERFDAAREHLETAVRFWRGRVTRQVARGLIDLIPVYLALDLTTDALAAAGELVEALAEDVLMPDFPAHAVFVAASAYAAAGNAERASELRAQARSLLFELAARIPDTASRERFLALPFHREIVASEASGPRS